MPTVLQATRIAGQLAGASNYGLVNHTDPLQAKFYFPTDIRLSVDETKMYVCDLGNNAIRVIDLVGASGVYTLYQGSLLKSPYQMFLNRATGNLFVTNTWGGVDSSTQFAATDTTNLSVVKVTPAGVASVVFQGNFPSAEPAHRPRGVACTPDESQFYIWQDGYNVGDFIQPHFTLMDSVGNLDVDYGTVGTSLFNETADVIWDRNNANLLYWTQYQFDYTGVWATDVVNSPTTGTRVIGGDLRGVYCTPSKLYYCNAGGGRIGQSNLDGTNQVSLGGLTPGPNEPISITAPDSDARCYVSDSGIVRSGGYWGYYMATPPTASNHCIWKIELGEICPDNPPAYSGVLGGPARVRTGIVQRISGFNGATTITDPRVDPCHPSQKATTSLVDAARVRLKRPF